MSLNYEVTNWENGKTVLKAEHLRKIEKGITDIISENDAIYKDEDTRKSNEINRQNTFLNKISEVNNKMTEINNFKENMTNTVSNKINEIETKFNELTISKQQDAEVIMARDGETSLKARLDRDIEKAKQVYVNVEGSNISTDSSDGYLKDVEILGNTIQDSENLADIRSVGDTVEGQELYEIPVLSRGKNLFDISETLSLGKLDPTTGDISLLDRSKDLIKTSTGFSVNVTSMYGGVVSDFISVKPNTTYVFSGINNTNVAEQSSLCYFDKDKNPIGNGWGDSSWRKSFTTPNDVYYFKISWWLFNPGIINYTNIQLEEGTVATLYEPYQEDKLTILSPVQLERVGDVADRIICKDGVWGVEKNVVTYHLKDFTQSNYNSFACRTVFPKFGVDFTNLTTTPFYTNLGYMHTNIDYQWNNRGIDSIAVDRAMISGQYEYVCDVTSENYVYNDVVKIIKDNDIWVKYALLEPQFIPLPHSQQIKLRTFANKTNISFGCEIEGTIKAQVPKSIGATVNTHTEQISNLNKELDRVKKLEESTVSTVTTESDFTTVEATSNGYFEDIKLEGKTLVVNIDNEIVEAGTEGATLKSVGNGADEIVVSSVNSDNTKSDKKRLLYYNEETQSWEKPILRQWDSIEKHANGKYYYHQRSGEVVLNGNEDWRINPKEGNITQGLLTTPNINTLVISDKFKYSQHNDVDECIWVYNKNNIVLNIAKSKLSTQDVTGFKQWLQANNVTVVYQLAQEKVYECTNIDLITYNGETNYVVESGAIVPKTTLKVHNNISNVVSLLQKKVSLLESNVKASQEVQDMMILETDMRMLDIELALIEFIPMKLNLGGSDMLRSATYFNFLKNHIINETYEKEYLENVMNKYLATGRINQDEYDELYKMLYPPVYDIELPIEY